MFTKVRPQYPRVSVVIPALNEAQNLPYVLPCIPSIVSEVVLVDGHSTDDTLAVARQLLPTIRIVKQAGKGKGNALRAGFAACTGDIIVMLDADGSADPNEIPRFVGALMSGCDFDKGSRFLQGGGSHDITLLRRAGNYWLSRFAHLLFRTRFSDLCYGYNAFLPTPRYLGIFDFASCWRWLHEFSPISLYRMENQCGIQKAVIKKSQP